MRISDWSSDVCSSDLFRRPPAGLEARIAQLWRSFPGKTGIAVRRIDGEWELSQRGEELFPQQRVSKLWVALTVLEAFDRGELSFNRTTQIGPEAMPLFPQPPEASIASGGSVAGKLQEP